MNIPTVFLIDSNLLVGFYSACEQNKITPDDVLMNWMKNALSQQEVKPPIGENAQPEQAKHARTDEEDEGLPEPPKKRLSAQQDMSEDHLVEKLGKMMAIRKKMVQNDPNSPDLPIVEKQIKEIKEQLSG